MRNIEYIVIHCSATKAQTKTSDIIGYWRNVLGWKKVGYQIIIGEDGTKERLADDEQITNGVSGHNHHSIHICYKGGKDGVDTRTHAQKKALIDLLKGYRKKYPNAKIVGHRDLSPDLNGDGKITPDEFVKLCPCFNAMIEYKGI